MLHAFESVRHLGAPNAKMCMVTNLNEAKETVGNLSNFAGVEWRAATLDEAAIARLLSQTHCLVHPTFWDSFGVVVLEALAAGCAVIASNMASLPEAVTKNNGILLALPIGQVVGDMTIPEFSDTRHFAELLSRLDLHGFERDLIAAMVDMATNPTRRSKYQEGARGSSPSTFLIRSVERKHALESPNSFPRFRFSITEQLKGILRRSDHHLTAASRI